MTEDLKFDFINLDDFIRFDDLDEQGKFNYIGKVVKLNKELKYFEMLTMNAYTQGFYMHTNKFDAKLSKVEKPVGWDKFEKDPGAYSKKKQEKIEEEKILKQTTKEQVFELVKNNIKLPKEKLLKKALQDIGGDVKLIGMFINVALMHNKRAENAKTSN